jgi:phosphate transport system permease protein
MSVARTDESLVVAGKWAGWRRALSPTGNLGDAIFRVLMLLVALFVVALVIAMVLALLTDSKLAMRQFGFRFLTSTNWNPIKGEFGALPFIYGTVMSSVIALLISVPLSLGIAVFLVEQAPPFVARPIGFLVELLAAIPSVVYGLWGIFVLAPFLRVYVEPVLARLFGWTPLFAGSITGIGMLTGGFILAIMITPIISAVVRDVLAAVPSTQREAEDLYLSALVELGLILFLVTFIVNGIARFLVWNVTRTTGGVSRAA